MAISPAEIQKYLKGIKYPATKQQLIDNAKKEGATEEVIQFLNNLEDKHYNSPTEVSEKLTEGEEE